MRQYRMPETRVQVPRATLDLSTRFAYLLIAIHGGALVSTCAVRGVRCRWSGYPPQSGKTFKCQQQRRSRPRCVSSRRRTPWRAVSDAVEVCDIRRLTLRPVRGSWGTSNRNTEPVARQSAPRFPTIYRPAIPVDACIARPGTGVQFPPPPVSAIDTEERQSPHCMYRHPMTI